MYTPIMTPTTKAATPVLLACFQAIAEETRFEVVRLLASGEKCVCELQDELDAAQSRLSFHLKKLKDAGVISDRRDGRWVYYSLVPDVLEQMRAFLGEVKDECCAWDSGAKQLVPLSAGRKRADAACC
jgi:ArsR family transcriptional regulator, arsenate/arsenite/antimonite-responsive transcriptional repressor